ncbi:MAG: hypothetical protein AAF942_17240, partial [Pseudomonadota bacterium]
MASRIDSGMQPTAHTAVQAMIVRAQQVADQTGISIGVHYDLETDELSIVEMGPDVPADTPFLRIVAPVASDETESPDLIEDGASGETPE